MWLKGGGGRGGGNVEGCTINQECFMYRAKLRNSNYTIPKGDRASLVIQH